MRRLCSTVLVFEVVIIVLAVLVATKMTHTRPGVAWAVGGTLAVIAVLLAGMVGRPRFRWALPAGSVLQVGVIATGVMVPVMYALGVIFAGLWATAIWLARRYSVP